MSQGRARGLTPTLGGEGSWGWGGTMRRRAPQARTDTGRLYMPRKIPWGGMPMCARCSAALGGKTHSGCTSKEPPPTHPGGLFLTSV